MLSVVLDNFGITLQVGDKAGTPIFYAMNLVDGSLNTTFYQANLGETGTIAADMTYSSVNNRVYILIKHDNGFSKIDFDPSTSSFSTSFKSSDRHAYFIQEVNGLTFMGGNIIANGENFISQYERTRDYSKNLDFILSPNSSTFVIVSGMTSASETVSVLSVAAIPASGNYSFSQASAGVYTPYVIDSYSSDIVFQGTYSETLYVQESYSGSMLYNFPCSISGGTAVSSSVIPDPVTASIVTWVSISNDGSSLNVTAPTIASGTTFHFGTRSMIAGVNVDKSVTLVLYQCTNPNCTS